MSGASRTKEEVHKVRRALRRYEEDLDSEFPYEAGSMCCTSCAYGSDSRYRALVDKIERVESWLRILERKVK